MRRHAITEGATSPIAEGLSPADRDFLGLTSLVRLTSAARWLEVSPATLRRHVHEGQCSGRKFGGQWFIGRGTVERWRVRRRMHMR
jgi:hypothetical protein